MITFFQQTAQAMMAKHIDRFPLLKLGQVIERPTGSVHLLLPKKNLMCRN